MEGLINFIKKEPAMMIATIGIDLAKNVFQVHGVDERGHVALRKQVRRELRSVVNGGAQRLKRLSVFHNVVA